MTQDLWTAVDQFIGEHFAPADDVLAAALADSDAAGLPAIQITAIQGKFLRLLVKLLAARRVLELGTLGGYSTIWLARALPAAGRLITLEYDPKHAAVAAKNIERAGLSDRVEIRLGAALDTLPRLADTSLGPFDLVFIDADKQNIAAYFDWAIRLSRPGSVIVVDNVVRKGAVIDAHSSDASVQGVRRFYDQAARDPRVEITALQTVGAKGYDGFAIARVI